MRTRAAALLLWMLAAAAHAACMDGGIGGTGAPRAEGGIGGTGARAEADLTLFGVITAFGSICVNGVEVHYNQATPVTLNGTPALAIGQTVLVQASSRGAGEAQASSIMVAAAVVGAVTAVDAANGIVHVAGQPVRIDPGTLLGSGLPADLPRSVRPGELLRVSGLATANGTIAATRVERAAAAAPTEAIQTRDFTARRFVVQGYVGATTGEREVRVGSVALAAEPSVAGSLAPDQLVRVSGHNDNGRLVVERAERLSSALNPRPERPAGARGAPAERPDNSGRNADRGPDRGPDRPDRPERPDRGGSDRPERLDRSGRH